MRKTNAIRKIESHGVEYRTIEYDPDSIVDGVKIAMASNLPIDQVFKTLVAEAKSKKHYVFIIPVEKELDLKKAADITGEKSISMLHLKELFGLTGYIRGGVSPIGMKKNLATFIDASGKSFETIYVSAGQKGLQVELSPLDLCTLVEGQFRDLVKGE